MVGLDSLKYPLHPISCSLQVKSKPSGMPVACVEILIFRESTSNRISSLQKQERKRLWEKSLQVRRVNPTAETVLRRGKLNVDGHGIYLTSSSQASNIHIIVPVFPSRFRHLTLGQLQVRTLEIVSFPVRKFSRSACKHHC